MNRPILYLKGFALLCVALPNLPRFPLLSPCLYSFTMVRYWNSYQVSILIFSSLSVLVGTVVLLSLAPSLSVLGRLFLGLRLSFPFQDTNSSIIPGLLEKESISPVYVRAGVQYALSLAVSYSVGNFCHEYILLAISNTNVCGNCAFGRGVDFKYRLKTYLMFGYIHSKKLTAFLPKTICLLFIWVIQKVRASYRNAFYRCWILTEITAWVLLSQSITITRSNFTSRQLCELCIRFLLDRKYPHYVNNEVSCMYVYISICLCRYCFEDFPCFILSGIFSWKY